MWSSICQTVKAPVNILYEYWYPSTPIEDPVKIQTKTLTSRIGQFIEYAETNAPYLTPEEIKQLKVSFHKVNKTFTVSPEIRSSTFFNFGYLLHQLCFHHNYETDLPDLNLSPEYLEKANKKWRQICKKLGWSYCPLGEHLV